MGKLNRIIQTGSSLLGLLAVDSHLPGREEALARLEALWPDKGGSCYRQETPQVPRTLSLSVIIPSYNNEGYVVPCIRSVLDQMTDVDYEVIVVNDGSTDGTQALLEETFGRDGRVRIVNQANRGLSGARNAGIDIARGEYLLFLDSDDKLLPGAVEALMAMARKENAAIVSGGYTCLFPGGRTEAGQSFRDEKVSPMGTLPGYAWGKVYRADLFDHLRFPEGYWFEDSISAQILWPQCLDSCCTVKESVIEYLMNPQGISAQATRKPKALDSLWLYRRLQQERTLFGLETTQADYEHFLYMTRLTYSRTRGFSQEDKKCIFVLQQQLKEQWFPGFRSQGGYAARGVERALEQGSYKRYVRMGELPV